MEQTSTSPGLALRVMQGVILGVVLAIPVLLYGYFQAKAANVEPPIAASGPSTGAKLPMRTVAAPVVSTRRSNSGKASGEVETIPASRMHIRIDRGDAPGVPLKTTPVGSQANDEE